MPDKALLDEKQLARTLNIPVASARRWRLLGQGPKFLKIGASVRYKPEDVDAWLDSRPAGGDAMAEERPPRAFDKAVLDALLKMAEKDKLKPGDFFKGVEMLDKIDRGRGRERLLREITWFLMALLAATFVSLILHSAGVLTLPAEVVQSVAKIIGAELIGLLTTIAVRIFSSHK